MTLHGPQADVYSVGNILYELLVGAPPKGTYLAPSELREDLPKELDDIIDLALAANPSDRYASPSDMKNAIRNGICRGLFAKQEVDNTNALIAMAIGVFFLAILGGYFFVMEKPDPYIEKMNADDIVEQVASQSESGLPSKDDFEKYNSRNPDMLYVPKGPVIIGRLNRELTIDKDIDGDGDPESANASTREDLVVIVDMEVFHIDRYEYPNKGSKASRWIVYRRSRNKVRGTVSACVLQKNGKRHVKAPTTGSTHMEMVTTVKSVSVVNMFSEPTPIAPPQGLVFMV